MRVHIPNYRLNRAQIAFISVIKPMCIDSNN